MEKRICMIGNIGPHYRYPIYNEMCKEFNCDFYLGDHINVVIKKFDYNSLKGFKGILYNHYFKNFYWQSYSCQLIFKPYTHYILNGEPYCLSSWFLLLLAKLLRKKTIAWTHGIYGHETPAKRKLKKKYYSLFSKIMLYSEYSLNLMYKDGFNKDKLLCIANSLDSDKDLAIRNTLHKTNIYKEHFGNDAPTVIYCGRIQKRKNLPLIIDSIKALKDEGHIANTIFIGEDVDGVNILEYAQKAGVSSQVWMYGPCYDETTLAELFYNAHVCVSPGNIGLTAIHALSFGCPTITHDNFAFQMPEFESIKPGITGDFFKEGDLSSLMKVIKKWLFCNEEARDISREEAFHEIDKKWNIHYQINILRQAFK